MTSYNLIKNTELSDKLNERDSQIKDAFGLTEAELKSIRSNTHVMDRIHTGAEILNERLTYAGVDPAKIPAQFTNYNLALLIDDGSYSKSPPIRTVWTALKRYYSGVRGAREKSTRLRPTYTQLLREDIVGYKDNLYQAKAKWPALKISKDDWLKDVKIPSRIGVEEAILLGIYFTQGVITHHQQDRNNDSKIYLFGRNCDFKFYEKTVLPLIKKVHNIIPTIPRGERLKNMINGNSAGYTYNIPSYEINSLAFTSWLQKCLFMSNSKDKREIPKIRNDDEMLGFFKGAIASVGYLYVYPKRSRMRTKSSNPSFNEGLKKVSEDLGFSPHLTVNGKVIDYSRSDIIKMIERDMFINPYHHRKTRNSKLV